MGVNLETSTHKMNECVRSIHGRTRWSWRPRVGEHRWGSMLGRKTGSNGTMGEDGEHVDGESSGTMMGWYQTDDNAKSLCWVGTTNMRQAETEGEINMSGAAQT